MQQRPERHYSLVEYFAIEEMSPNRNEFFDGQIFAMSGASINHIRIVREVSQMLAPLAGRGCEHFLNDLRVATPTGLYTFPDLTVICGGVKLTGDPLDTVTNPIVLVEVLSKSTRDYDRGEKFRHYRSIPTLRDYLLIDQYSVEIEHRWRDGEEWRSDRYTDREASFTLKGVPATISAAGVYHRVEF